MCRLVLRPKRSLLLREAIEQPDALARIQESCPYDVSKHLSYPRYLLLKTFITRRATLQV